jgi:hypothetical protein
MKQQATTMDPPASSGKERRFGRAIRSGARFAAANCQRGATALNAGMLLSRPNLSECSCGNPIKTRAKVRFVADCANLPAMLGVLS